MSESAPESSDVEAEQMLAEAVAQPDSEATPEKSREDQQESQGKDWEAEVAKWKSLSRKWEKDAKANAEAARKYAEFEDSQKTEQQRLAERLADAEQRAAQAEIGRSRLLAAATYNIPASLLDRIGGGTEDEINESAQALSEEIERLVAERLAATPPPPTPAPTAAPTPTRPVESLTPGAMPANSEPEDGNAFLRWMAGRKS